MTSDEESRSVAESSPTSSPPPRPSKTRRADLSSDEDEDAQRPPKIRRVGRKRVGTPDSSEDEAEAHYDPNAWSRMRRHYEREVSPAGSLFSELNPQELYLNSLPEHIRRTVQPLVARLGYEAEKATVVGIATKTRVVQGHKRPRERGVVPTRPGYSVLSFGKKGVTILKGKHQREHFRSDTNEAVSSNAPAFNDWDIFGSETGDEHPSAGFHGSPPPPAEPSPPREPPTPEELLRLAGYSKDEADGLDDFDDGENAEPEEDDLYVTPQVVQPPIPERQVEVNEPATQLPPEAPVSKWKMNRKFLET